MSTLSGQDIYGQPLLQLGESDIEGNIDLQNQYKVINSINPTDP